MSTIKMLVVADGVFSFAPQQDPENRSFTITYFLSTLRNSVFPTISVDTAHRRGDGNAAFQNFNFATSIPNLSVYDEIWMFGYEGTDYNPEAPGPPPGSLAFINDNELAAIARFMDGGGGVFATGDHSGLGSLMCGKIPRVRSMRKWFSPYDTDSTIPPAAMAIPNWDAAGPNRADTLWPFDDGMYYFDNQSDDIPMTLFFPSEPAHPILQGPYGEITFFPDHMSEGEVLGYGGFPGFTGLLIPYNLLAPWSLTYNYSQVFSAAIPAAGVDTAVSGKLAIFFGGGSTPPFVTSPTNVTMGDVIREINSATQTRVNATLDNEGHGHLVLTDTLSRGTRNDPLTVGSELIFAGLGGENNTVITTFTSTVITSSETLIFNGQLFVEYPIGCPSSADPGGWQERPIIIAMASCLVGHETPEDSRCVQIEPGAHEQLLSPQAINVLSVYDGQNACTTDTGDGGPRVGRVVTDSSFHHYLDLNLIGDPCASGTKQKGFQTARGAPVLVGLKAFYINTVVWLANRPRLEVGLSPNPVPAGSQNATGTVEVNTVIPDSGLQFNLTSSNPSMVAVPSAPITVLPGQPASASFSIATSVVPPGAQASAYIAAAFSGAPPPGFDPSARALLTVLGPPPPPPPPGVLVSLSVSPEMILFGDSAVGTVTIGQSTQDVTVVLSSTSVVPVATVPPSVKIPAGQTTAMFDIDTSYVPRRLVTVTIYASAGGVKLDATLAVVRSLPQP